MKTFIENSKKKTQNDIKIMHEKKKQHNKFEKGDAWNKRQIHRC